MLPLMNLKKLIKCKPVENANLLIYTELRMHTEKGYVQQYHKENLWLPRNEAHEWVVVINNSPLSFFKGLSPFFTLQFAQTF